MRLGSCALSLLVLSACGTSQPDPSTITMAGASSLPSAGISSGGSATVPTTPQGGQAGGATTPTAGSASGGMAPMNMLTLRQPIERDGKLVLEFGDTYFAVDPARGARISSLRVAGHELLH